MKYDAQVDKDHRIKAAAVIDRLVSKGNAAESSTSETDAHGDSQVKLRCKSFA